MTHLLYGTHDWPMTHAEMTCALCINLVPLPQVCTYFPPSAVVLLSIHRTKYPPSMSRHNRRRTRHKANHSPSFELPLLPPPPTTATFASAPPPCLIHACHDVDNRPAAKRWPISRTPTWQWQRQHLEAERMRIFGGSSGEETDEEGLCGKMMEFFGGLDFIHG